MAESGETKRIRNMIITTIEEDICIDDIWWFGQIGSSEPWTNWFVLDKQWQRVEKLKELGI
jgi:hypothetical protein